MRVCLDSVTFWQMQSIPPTELVQFVTISRGIAIPISGIMRSILTLPGVLLSPQCRHVWYCNSQTENFMLHGIWLLGSQSLPAQPVQIRSLSLLPETIVYLPKGKILYHIIFALSSISFRPGYVGDQATSLYLRYKGPPISQNRPRPHWLSVGRAPFFHGLPF